MDKIEIESSLNIKASPDCKTIAHKAIAGISDAELIKRYTIGEYQKNEDEEQETSSD